MEVFLANHCAPVLYGKKPAALFAQKLITEKQAQALLELHGLHTFPLKRRNKSVLTLVYRPGLLSAALSREDVAQALTGIGYPPGGPVGSLLLCLRRRFGHSDEFPHEVGFFLGYPPEDVLGFMHCKDNCKLCGQWKVYGDVDKAAALFEEYALCRQVLQAHIQNGGSLFAKNLPALAG